VTLEERRSVKETTVDDVGNRENGEPQERAWYDERDAQRHGEDHEHVTETGPARRGAYFRVGGGRGVGIQHRERFLGFMTLSNT
jgi:hypothetical protein